MAHRQLVLELACEALPAAEDACRALGALAVSLFDAGDEPLLEPAPGETPLWRSVRLVALFDERTDLHLVAATLCATLALPAGAVREEAVPDRAWEREWLRDFRPMRFGRRLWVCPAGQPPGDPGGVAIALDPGLAFGTGTHATTALCLEWLDGQALAGARVLDWGCGSGILALAALALGAGTATAWDIDPQARLATAENAARNGLDARIAIPASPPERAAAFDVVLANILACPLVELAPQLASRCRAGGWIALAGLLARDAPEVAAAYRPWFDIAAVAEREGWSLLAGQRRPE